MAEFDYGALWEGVCDVSMGSACGEENCPECQAAATYLREQIEAAFVPLSTYGTTAETFSLKLAAETLRAEAAEAEVARLRRFLGRIATIGSPVAKSLATQALDPAAILRDNAPCPTNATPPPTSSKP